MAEQPRGGRWGRRAMVLGFVLVHVAACGAGTRQTRLNVTVSAEPSDAVVDVTQGTRTLAKGPSPLTLDDVWETRGSSRGGYAILAVVGGGLALVGLGVAVSQSGGYRDGELPPISAGAVAIPVLLTAGIVLAVVGGVGLATASPAPPFTVGATRPGYGFPRRTFEPSDERQTFELTGVPDPEPSPSEPEPPESGGRP